MASDNKYTEKLKYIFNTLKTIDLSEIDTIKTNMDDYFDTLKAYMNDINISKWEFKCKKQGLKDINNCSELFTNILLHYNTCLDYIKLFVYSDTISICLILYILNSLNNIELNLVINIGEIFITKFNSIIEIWNYIVSNNDSYTTSNNFIGILVHNIIIKTIYIIYAYYFYINRIKDYIDSNPQIIIASVDIMQLIKHIFNGTDLEEIDTINKILNIKKDIFREHITNYINNKLLDDDSNNGETTILRILPFSDNKATVIDKINSIITEIRKIDPLNAFYIQILTIIINYILNYTHTTYETINNYITIPQYFGNCWYISMITGMCYSDRSLKLIQTKISPGDSLPPPLPSDSNELITFNSDDIDKINTINNSFTSYIKYIINKITSQKLQYSKDLTTDCDHFKEFKKNQTNYIDEMYKYLLPQLKHKLGSNFPTINKEDLPNFISHIRNVIGNNKNNTGSAFSYYYSIFISNLSITLNKSKTDEKKLSNLAIFDTLKLEQYGMHNFNYILIAYLYYLLNIKTLYLYIVSSPDNAAIYYKSKIDLYSNIDPDILFIDYIPDSYITGSNTYLQEYPSIASGNNFSIKDEIIIFNNNIYVLDYILINNNSDDMVCSRATGKCSTGHCISAITYNKQKYIYNSQFNINRPDILSHTVKCDPDRNIRISCPLIKQDWNIKVHTCFSMRECYNKEIVDMSIMASSPHDNTTNLCYRVNDIDTIHAYVKSCSLDDIGVTMNDTEENIKKKLDEYEAKKAIEDAIEAEAKAGGAKKSSNKIKIIINKKIINRVVFKINSIKCVKINNNNVELSNFKYSKKYNVYYIKTSDLNIYK